MKIGGKVEVFTPRMVNGWLAIYGNNLNEHPKLEVLLDGVILATATAENYREDIASKGFGDGRCHYRITLPKTLNDTEMQRLQLRIAATEVYLELPRPASLPAQTVPAPLKNIASPVFIVGSPRSGTSVLALALLRAGYHGFAEGNLLGLSQLIYQTVDWYFTNQDTNIPGTLLGNVRADELKDRLFSVFKEILDQRNPQAPWLDKTGNVETLYVLPRIMKAWESGRVIFIKRHGVENIASRLNKFPKRDFTQHCIDWANNMRVWRTMRDHLDTDRIIEIDQRELLETPDSAAAKLAEFLGLSEDNKNTVEDFFRTQRPEESFPGSSAKKLRINNVGWTQDQIKTFEAHCSEEMKFYGYQMTNEI